MRRLLRECFRIHRAAFKKTADIVAIARPDLAAARFAEAEREWLRLCVKLGLIERAAMGAGAQETAGQTAARPNPPHTPGGS